MTQLALRFRVVRPDPKEQLCIGTVLLAFMQLIRVVKCHHLDANLLSIPNLWVCLAWVGENDVMKWDDRVEVEDFGDFVFRCTIESDSQGCKESQDGRIWIAFDGVKGFDARKMPFPPEELTIDFPQVCDKEGIFDVGIDVHLERCLLLFERLKTSTKLIPDCFVAETRMHVGFDETIMWKWISHSDGHFVVARRVNECLWTNNMV
jgi:hypothetical protein